MRKEEFYFDSRDGESKIYAVRYLPDDDKVTCILQIIHGAAEYMKRYEEFAQFLTQKGIVVVGEDHLGHGKTLKKEDTPGYFCDNDPATVLVRDVHRLKKLTQEKYPGVPYVIFGHSLGSFMLRDYMLRYGKGISGAIISGTGYYSKSEVRLAKSLAAILKKFKGPMYISGFLNKTIFTSKNNAFAPADTDFDWFSKEADRVAAYVADPLCGFPFTINGFEALFQILHNLNDNEALVNVPKELPLLVISGAKDPVGENGKGVHQVADALKESGHTRVELKLYEDDRHELLNETDREQVMQDIYQWIEEQILA